MASKTVSFLPSASSEQTAEVLKRRLATAEQDTAQLMQALEEMGFNTKNECKRHVDVSDGKKVKSSMKDVSEKQSAPRYEISQTLDSSSIPTKSHPQCDRNESHTTSTANIPTNTDRHSSSKSAKHRPITPLSLKGLIPGAFDETETKNYDNYVIKPPQAKTESDNKGRQRHDGGEGKVRICLM